MHSYLLNLNQAATQSCTIVKNLSSTLQKGSKHNFHVKYTLIPSSINTCFDAKTGSFFLSCVLGLHITQILYVSLPLIVLQ